jgi:hypothetical protein
MFSIPRQLVVACYISLLISTLLIVTLVSAAAAALDTTTTAVTSSSQQQQQSALRRIHRNPHLQRRTTLRGAILRRHDALDIRGANEIDVDDIDVNDDDCCPDVQELFFDQQRLDHFRGNHKDDTNVTRTTNDKKDPYYFRQRYFYTNRYVHEHDRVWDHHEIPVITMIQPRQSSSSFLKRSKIPLVFVCMGGEGPALTKHVLLDSVHCTGDMIHTTQKIYRQHNRSVHLYALEHRYYGQLYPDFTSSSSNDTTANDTATSSSPVANHHLVYLSSKQALMDVVHWKSMDGPLPKLHAVFFPWIVFGGSYPGSGLNRDEAKQNKNTASFRNMK